MIKCKKCNRDNNCGMYFISIGIGKVLLRNNIYYCISSKSPIGNQLIGKYLVCETVRRQIMVFSPHLKDAQIDMGKLENLVK